MSDELFADRTEDPTFIHSGIDDLGLTVYEFRIYCHLKRRANHGTAWPGHAAIAKVCRMSRRQVIYSLQELSNRGMITVERQEGRVNHYHLTRPSLWGDATSAPPAPVQDVHPPCAPQALPPVQDMHPKVIHKKVIQEGTPHSPPRGQCTVKFESKFVEFWNQLPKANRIGLGKTKEAWNKQVSNGSTPDEILEGVEKLVKYEKLRKDQDPNGYRALHPTTWLNQERWNDGETMESEELFEPLPL
jgi:hypothetical protein